MRDLPESNRGAAARESRSYGARLMPVSKGIRWAARLVGLLLAASAVLSVAADFTLMRDGAAPDLSALQAVSNAISTQTIPVWGVWLWTGGVLLEGGLGLVLLQRRFHNDQAAVRAFAITGILVGGYAVLDISVQLAFAVSSAGAGWSIFLLDILAILQWLLLAWLAASLLRPGVYAARWLWVLAALWFAAAHVSPVQAFFTQLPPEATAHMPRGVARTALNLGGLVAAFAGFALLLGMWYVKHAARKHAAEGVHYEPPSGTGQKPEEVAPRR